MLGYRLWPYVNPEWDGRLAGTRIFSQHQGGYSKLLYIIDLGFSGECIQW